MIFLVATRQKKYCSQVPIRMMVGQRLNSNGSHDLCTGNMLMILWSLGENSLNVAGVSMWNMWHLAFAIFVKYTTNICLFLISNM